MSAIATDLVKASLLRQNLVALEMLHQCVERCPDELWLSGKHPRTFWRIAYHAAYYAHLYLYPGLKEYEGHEWSKARAGAGQLWGRPKKLEPYTQTEILEFVDLARAELPGCIEAMDLSSPETGYPWYPGLPLFEHQILTLRHLHGHIGQLSELLNQQGIDTDWMGQLDGPRY